MKKGGINIIKDLDTSKREVVFAFSKFDYDSDGDYTEKTAFDKTIRESGPEGSNRIRHVWNHSKSNMPIGAVKEMWRDEEYAYVRSAILKKNQNAVSAWEAYESGAINEHSYWGKAYNTQTNEKGGKLIKEVKLMEVSTVLWGAQENAKLIDMIKSGVKPDKYLLDHLENLEKYVKKSNANDDFLEVLEIELFKAKDIISKSLEITGREITPIEEEPISKGLSLTDIYRLKR